MNTEKVFAKMLKAHSKGECVSLVTDYENAKEITKLNKAEYQNITTVDKLDKNDKALFTKLIKQYGAK